MLFAFLTLLLCASATALPGEDATERRSERHPNGPGGIGNRDVSGIDIHCTFVTTKRCLVARIRSGLLQWRFHQPQQQSKQVWQFWEHSQLALTSILLGGLLLCRYSYF